MTHIFLGVLIMVAGLLVIYHHVGYPLLLKWLAGAGDTAARVPGGERGCHSPGGGGPDPGVQRGGPCCG
ncbi:MAG: hypothetical protein JZU52_09295 [Lamprocystis purpurea]|nr:hypothetical protein [Lamprocystis purpurea]